MEQKPYQEITITDITKKAGVSRMSYYRIYKSKDDILIQYFNDIFEECLHEIENTEKIDRFQFAVKIFQTCQKYHVLLESVLRAKLYDLILQCLVRYCTYLAEHIFEMDMKKSKTEYWIYGEAGKFSLLILCWLNKGMPQSPEEMASLFLAHQESSLS